MIAASRLTSEQRKKCDCGDNLVATIMGYYCVKCRRNWPFGTV